MTEYITEWYWDEKRNAPNQDQREEIVRCSDCKWYCEEWNRKRMRFTHSCDWFDGSHVEPDGFCKWGERKDENGR